MHQTSKDASLHPLRPLALPTLGFVMIPERDQGPFLRWSGGEVPLDRIGSGVARRYAPHRSSFLRKSRCAHQKRYIPPLRTTFTYCSRPEARLTSGAANLSARRVSAAVPTAVFALVFTLVGSIAVDAKVISVPSADPPSSTAPLPPPTVIRGSPPSAVRPVAICPRGYTLSPGYGCIGLSNNDYSDDAVGWPGNGRWPEFSYGDPFSGFPGFGFDAGRFHRFAGFHARGGFHGRAPFHGAARFGGLSRKIGHMGGFGWR